MDDAPIEHPQLKRLYVLQHQIMEQLSSMAQKLDEATGLIAELSEGHIELSRTATTALERLRANTEAELLTIDEVARILGMSKMTLWRLRAKGAIVQPIRISAKKVVFLRSDLEEWIARQRK